MVEPPQFSLKALFRAITLASVCLALCINLPGDGLKMVLFFAGAAAAGWTVGKPFGKGTIGAFLGIAVVVVVGLMLPAVQ